MTCRIRSVRHATAIAIALCLAACAGKDPAQPDKLVYPVTATVEHVDTYHGVEVADPYRRLEEDVRESERVRRWVEAQNAVTFEYLQAIPFRLEGGRIYLSAADSATAAAPSG